MVKDRWYLVNINLFDNSETELTIYLSRYKLPNPEILEQRGFSPLRELALIEAIVEPGHASGTMLLGGRSFKLKYAWGGLNTKEDFRLRETYTVLASGECCEKFILSLARQINNHEGVKTRTFLIDTVLDFPRIQRVNPWEYESNYGRK